MRSARLAVAVLFALLCVAFAAATAAGGAEPASDVYEVSIYLHSSTNPNNILSLEIFPAEGVAVAKTFYGREVADESGATYSMAITPARFDESLDLRFPGLGEVVGTVTPNKVRGPVAVAKLCEHPYGFENATFEGRIAFHGAGDPRRWRATAEEAAIVPACGVHLERHNGPASLFHHIGEGPGFGGAFVNFFANTESKTRQTQFAAVGDLRDGDPATLLAYDTEWLHDEIATQRWVKRYASSFAKVLHFPRKDTDPSRITVTPPAPFYGRGTYLKRTGKLTGSLGVHFPGLKVRLAQPPAEVIFEDEERGTGA
jgi:hypothetical protein